MSGSLRTRFHNLLVRPHQLMIMDATGAGRSRRLCLRPVTVIAIAVMLLGLSGWGGYQISTRIHLHATEEQGEAWPIRRLRLQHYQNQLAEADSELALRQSQIENMKKEIRAQQERIEQLKLRLRMFESILTAQKAAGIHILRAEANWRDADTLAYRVVLVKGGSLPRRVRGSIRLTARGPDGQALVLPLGEKTSELPYQMETHTFLHGSLAWRRDWKPDRILVSRLNRKGAIREEVEIPIRGGDM